MTDNYANTSLLGYDPGGELPPPPTAKDTTEATVAALTEYCQRLHGALSTLLEMFNTRAKVGFQRATDGTNVWDAAKDGTLTFTAGSGQTITIDEDTGEMTFTSTGSGNATFASAGSSPPASPDTGDTWYVTADGGGKYQGETYRWDGTSWVLVGNPIYNTTITAGKIELDANVVDTTSYRKMTADQYNGIDSSTGRIRLSVKGADLSGTPDAAGLWLTSSYMGYYDGSAWTVYIASDGTCKFGGEDSYMKWDNTSLSVKGTSVEVVAEIDGTNETTAQLWAGGACIVKYVSSGGGYVAETYSEYSTFAPKLHLRRSHTTTFNEIATTQSGDRLGTIIFSGVASSSWSNGASIIATQTGSNCQAKLEINVAAALGYKTFTFFNDGTFEAPTLKGALDSSVTYAGTWTAANIPSLDASKITTGTFDTARIPTLAGDKISGGTFGAVDASALTNLNASELTGNLDPARLDFSAGSTSGRFYDSGWLTNGGAGYGANATISVSHGLSVVPDFVIAWVRDHTNNDYAAVCSSRQVTTSMGTFVNKVTSSTIELRTASNYPFHYYNGSAWVNSSAVDVRIMAWGHT